MPKRSEKRDAAKSRYIEKKSLGAAVDLRALAAELVEEAAYQPVTAGTLARALAVLERCGKAVCTLPAFGPLNEANRLLWEAAKQNGKQVDWNTV